MVQEQTYPQSTPDYTALLQQYGEAMLRIGQLEAQVDELPKGSVESTSAKEGPTKPRDDEISQLRLRVTSLSNQLALAQQEAGRTNEKTSRKRRRHSPRNRPAKWMFWRKRRRD